MLTPYAYLADGYLVFLRALRQCVRTRLEDEFGKDCEEWWDDVVGSALGKTKAKVLSKNIEELYRAQEAEQLSKDPFEALDPFHCERIIDKHYADVFPSVFPNRNDILGRLNVINATRNKAFAHPRSATISPEDVKAALDDMIAVLRRPPGNQYEGEVVRLQALATVVEGFVLNERAKAQGDLLGERDAGKSDVGGIGSAEEKRMPVEEGFARDAGNEPSWHAKLGSAVGLEEGELAMIGRAIRARKSGQGPAAFTPLRYVWGELESRVPGKYPSEGVLYAALVRYPERFEIRRSTPRSVLVREVKRGKGISKAR